MADIPKGYKAANPFADIYSVDSATLSETGEIHGGYKSYWPDEWLLGTREARDLDSFVEMSIKGDERLERLKVTAIAYGEKYCAPSSQDYIAKVAEREKTITNLVVHDIGLEFGPYSEDTIKNRGNSAEFKATGWRTLFSGTQTIQSKDVEKGTAVCRNYAPWLSTLLHAACVKNQLVYAPMTRTSKKANKTMEIDKFMGPHVVVITDEGNAIIEATVAGREDESKIAYRPILNGVTADNIVYDGKLAITDISVQAGKGTAYGGHDGNGNNKTAEAAIKSRLKEYNDTILKASLSKHVENAVGTMGRMPVNEAIEINPPSRASVITKTTTIAKK